MLILVVPLLLYFSPLRLCFGRRIRLDDLDTMVLPTFICLMHNIKPLRCLQPKEVIAKDIESLKSIICRFVDLLRSR